MRRKLFPLLFLILVGCAGCEAIVIGLAVGGGIAAGGWLFDKAVSHHSSTSQPAPSPTPTQLSRVPSDPLSFHRMSWLNYPPSWGDAGIGPNGQGGNEPLADLKPAAWTWTNPTTTTDVCTYERPNHFYLVEWKHDTMPSSVEATSPPIDLYDGTVTVYEIGTDHHKHQIGAATLAGLGSGIDAGCTSFLEAYVDKIIANGNGR